jgi:hypothetical protein
MSFRSLVAGIALFSSVSALAVGLVLLTEQPSTLSFAYLGGGAVAFRVAWRQLVPRKVDDQHQRASQ